MSFTLESTPKKGKHTASRVLDGEAVIFLPATAQVRILNKVGSKVWEMMDGERTVKGILDAVCEMFDVDRPTAERDVLEFLEALAKDGMAEA